MRINHILTAKNFRPYGWIIEYPKKAAKSDKRNLFRIVLKEKKPLGWRIAFLVVRDKKVNKFEQHPDSFESFEPVSGESLLYVSVDKELKKIDVFRLDKPIILKKCVWHAIVCVGSESEVKITENASVRCVYKKIECSL